MNPEIDKHRNDSFNPHGVTAEQVGLGRVSNESKEELLHNANLTGAPTAPTVDITDSSNSVATTEFVERKISAVPGLFKTLETIDRHIESNKSIKAWLFDLISQKISKKDIDVKDGVLSINIPNLTKIIVNGVEISLIENK